MATLNLSITIPDDNVDDLKQALILAFPKKLDSSATNAEIRQVINDFVVEEMKKVYRSWKRRQFEAGIGSEGGITE